MGESRPARVQMNMQHGGRGGEWRKGGKGEPSGVRPNAHATRGSGRGVEAGETAAHRRLRCVVKKMGHAVISHVPSMSWYQQMTKISMMPQRTIAKYCSRVATSWSMCWHSQLTMMAGHHVASSGNGSLNSKRVPVSGSSSHSRARSGVALLMVRCFPLAG